MKGTIVSDTIGVLAIIIMIFIFFFQIFPRILEIITDIFSKTSAEAVAKQLASFITVSGAATYRIEISYIPSRTITYNIQTNNRMIKVNPNYKVTYGEKTSALHSYAVPIEDFSFRNVNFFKIEKIFEDGDSYYSIHAEKVE
ncbi:MAG: hypothetical protein QXG39_03755 [Candidatus Aenigmatarchaeota archaeon]